MRTPWPWETEEESKRKARALRRRSEHDRRLRDRRVSSEMIEFRDAHDEWKTTRSPSAAQKRLGAMFASNGSVAQRQGLFLAGESAREGSDKRERLRRHKFSGWVRKE